MNVDPVSDDRETDSHRALREMRDRCEVDVSRDDLVRAIAKRARNAGRGESNALEILSGAGAGERHPFKPAGPVRFPEEFHIVSRGKESQRKLAAEHGNTAAKPLEAGSPEMNFQVVPRASWPVAGNGRAVGFGHRSHAHRHRNPAATAAAAPPVISTIEPLG